MESKLLDKVTGAFELDLPSDLQTMPQFIEFIVPKVQPWSEDLREEKFYVGKRWVEIQDRDAWDKSFIHIFMDGGEYLFSDNGILTRKTWRYLAESNTMILETGKDTILYDLIFLNGDMMILQQNGTSRYLVLGEEEFTKKNIKQDWRMAMEALYNIYRENSKFSVWAFALVIGIALFIYIAFFM